MTQPCAFSFYVRRSHYKFNPRPYYMFRRFFFWLSSIGKPDNVRGRRRGGLEKKVKICSGHLINMTALIPLYLQTLIHYAGGRDASETERERGRENGAGCERAKFLHQNYANESLESSFSACAKLLSWILTHRALLLVGRWREMAYMRISQPQDLPEPMEFSFEHGIKHR